MYSKEHRVLIFNFISILYLLLWHKRCHLLILFSRHLSKRLYWTVRCYRYPGVTPLNKYGSHDIAEELHSIPIQGEVYLMQLCLIALGSDIIMQIGGVFSR